ncbi:DoxX family protein [Salipaludibacillus agaradhaerens]|uniref:DoxX family protein n=1 Tax=Salipaludibacillus agaradhaerens TaxID=76935 RepID=UPI0009965E2A|nr:DoxX family protein [Salipaludibacillus agaradhaerens]
MSNKNEIGNLLLRVVLGLVFLGNGAAKFQGGIENTVGWFDSIGLPGGLAYVVAIIELVGGIALILGLGTRIAAALMGLIMIGAIFTVNLEGGFLNGYAFDLVLLVVAAHLVLNGSKLSSLDQLVFKNKHQLKSFVESA